MFVKTMAVRITKETYPIALACLPGGFANIPLELVLNQVLVINQPESEYLNNVGDLVVLKNFWMPASLFFEEYETVNPTSDDDFEIFTEVARVRRAEVKDRRPERDAIMDAFHGRGVSRRSFVRRYPQPTIPRDFDGD